MKTTQPASKHTGQTACALAWAFLLFGLGFNQATAAGIVSFQQGVNGYSGTQDTYILRTSPTTITHAQTVVQIRDTMQGLLRFDDLFGTSPGQIPPGATMPSARLILTTHNDSIDSISMHRMLVPWTGPNAHWDFFDDGISLEAGEARATADQVFVPIGAAGSLIELDVTDALRAWAEGLANQGWVFFGSGTDTYRFHSSEAVQPGVRPLLRVEYFESGPIMIIEHPAPQSVHEGESVTFQVGFSGEPPYSFQWFFNGETVPGATNAILHIPGITTEHAGIYSVRAGNPLDESVSEGAELVVLPPVAITIDAGPVDTVAAAGQAATFSVTVAGTVPSYQWFKAGTPIPFGTNSTLTLSNLTLEDAGLYEAVVSNPISSAAASAFLLVAPEPFRPGEILGLHHTWKYNQQGVDLGTAWREPVYEDAGWPSGQGLLAHENNPLIVPLIRTTLSLTNSAGEPIRTYYFRTTFNLPHVPHNAALMASSYIDDGAVFYLNGVEVWRYYMPFGEVTYNTLAVAAPPEGVAVEAALPMESLIAGTNVLAVEVHQVNLTSSDVVFGTALSLAVVQPSPLAITSQPGSASVDEGHPLTLSAGLSGAGAFIQWFKDGRPIPQARSLNYVVSGSELSDGGVYHFTAANALSAVVSEPAVITVLADTIPPLLRSSFRLGVNTVEVEFSEPLDEASAVELQNYSIQAAGTATSAGVLAVELLPPHRVRLTTEMLEPDQNYILTVEEVRDASARGNVIAPGSSIPIATTVTVFPYETAWTFRSFETFPAENWFAPDYDDLTWESAFAPFAHDPESIPFPQRTSLDYGPDQAALYFRKRFDLNGSLLGAKFWLHHVVADGVVIYLNGVEVARTGMPAGPVTHTTPASRSVPGEAREEGPFELPADLLLPAGNVLAAEIHQGRPPGIGAAFAVQLSAQILSFAHGAIVDFSSEEDLVISEGEGVTLSRIALGGAGFQWHRNGVVIPGATLPSYHLVAAMDDDGARFSLALSNATESGETAGITLRMIPDRTPPRLVSANFENMNRLVVEFSEPVDPASSGVVSNYEIQLPSGETWGILGATPAGTATVILEVEAGSLNGAPVLRARGVKDTSAAANVVDSSIGVRIGFSGPLIDLLGSWKYNDSGADLGSGWREPGYDDSPWPVGEAVLEARLTPRSIVGGQPVNTQLSWATPGGDAVIACYFRTEFPFPVAPDDGVFQAELFVDDGAVVYVNGQEAMRLGMPAGPVSSGTFANRTVGTATIEGPFELSPALFVTGMNRIAVEVHKGNLTSSDATFALSLRAQIPSAVVSVTPLPDLGTLRVSRQDDQIILSWEEEGWTLLQSQTVLPGNWTPVENQANPYVIPSGAPALFFQLTR